MSVKIRTYRNTQRFCNKFVTDLLEGEENTIEFRINAYWRLRLKLDRINNTIAVQDLNIDTDTWRNVVQLYITDKGYLEVKATAELSGITSKIEKLIMFMINNIAHNGRTFFIC